MKRQVEKLASFYADKYSFAEGLPDGSGSPQRSEDYKRTAGTKVA